MGCGSVLQSVWEKPLPHGQPILPSGTQDHVLPLLVAALQPEDPRHALPYGHRHRPRSHRAGQPALWHSGRKLARHLRHAALRQADWGTDTGPAVTRATGDQHWRRHVWVQWPHLSGQACGTSPRHGITLQLLSANLHIETRWKEQGRAQRARRLLMLISLSPVRNVRMYVSSQSHASICSSDQTITLNSYIINRTLYDKTLS